MASGSIVRCMGAIGADAAQRKMCNSCKRLPRNRDDEDAISWVKASSPCEHHVVADIAYLKRHEVGKGPY